MNNRGGVNDIESHVDIGIVSNIYCKTINKYTYTTRGLYF